MAEEAQLLFEKLLGYANYAEVLDYCRRSANPVGRLLLHLFGQTSSHAFEQSDAICVVLSEETGTISIARNGRMVRNLDEARLRNILQLFMRADGRRGL